MKTLITAVILSASLALSGNVAMAAAGKAKVATKTATHVAPTRRVAAQTPPQAMYKDIVRPNGQKRSEAVYQADVDACYGQTGGSPYLPDSAAMKKCMLGYGFQFVWQRGFGGGSGGAVVSSSGSSDDDSVQQTLLANHQAEQQQEEQNAWALQQSIIQEEQQSANMASEQAEEMNESMAATAAQNALAEDMINQDMMNEVNSR